MHVSTMKQAHLHRVLLRGVFARVGTGHVMMVTRANNLMHHTHPLHLVSTTLGWRC